MKTVKRALALVLALTLLLAMSATVFAAAQTYSITVKNENKSISIKDNTYYAYRIFDATYNGDNVAYTVNENFAGFTYTVSDKNYQGEALINYLADLTADSAALDAFAKAALDYATTNHIAAAGTVKATDETAVISVDAPGYYLVAGTATAPNNQTVTAACSLTTAKPDAEVNVKADVPSIDKKIVEESGKVEANTANIGDKVSYEITSKVPNMTGYTKYFFVLNDTLSKGLTFNNDVKVKIGETELAADAYSVTSTTNRDGTTSVKIVLNNFINYQEKNGQTILVTYSATLNRDAEVGTTPNTNAVKLVYSNDPNHTYTGENEPAAGDPTGETPESKTETYTTELTITKTDGNGQILTGAEFTLTGNSVNIVLVSESTFTEGENGTYWKLKNGTYTTTEPTTENQASYNSTETKYSKTTTLTAKGTDQTETSVKGYVDNEGKVTFRGLGAGGYMLAETVTPAGYNTIEPIKFTISFNKDTKTFSTDNKNISVGTDNTLSTTIVNNAGAELPSTGGIGTTVFYVLGGLLVVCAGVLLITKRRMNKNA